MDAMKLRLQGTPQSSALMKFNLFCFRICLAAHFAGAQADIMLGRQGHALKRLIERTHSAPLVLQAFIRNAHLIVGFGGQYIVMDTGQDEPYLDKYSYTMAGADRKVLRRVITEHRKAQGDMLAQFGSLVLPTEYAIDHLPAHRPLGNLLTIRARQTKLPEFIDLFDPAARLVLRAPGSGQLRNDVRRLTRGIHAWLKHSKWLDLIGPENIVITNELNGRLRLKIIDTELYAPAYLSSSNPVVGKTYRQVFEERLAYLDKLCAGL